MRWIIAVSLAALCILGLGLWLLDQLNNQGATPVPVAQDTLSIVLTPDGFVPKEPTIQLGTTVTFSNTTGREYWPASDLHPSHAIYSAFDPARPLQPDEMWAFTFEKVGSWGLHDHIRSYYTGLIHVVE